MTLYNGRCIHKLFGRITDETTMEHNAPLLTPKEILKGIYNWTRVLFCKVWTIPSYRDDYSYGMYSKDALPLWHVQSATSPKAYPGAHPLWGSPKSMLITYCKG